MHTHPYPSTPLPEGHYYTLELSTFLSPVCGRKTLSFTLKVLLAGPQSNGHETGEKIAKFNTCKYVGNPRT